MAVVNSTTNGVDSSVSGLTGLAYPILDQVCVPISCFNQSALIRDIGPPIELPPIESLRDHGGGAVSQ